MSRWRAAASRISSVAAAAAAESRIFPRASSSAPSLPPPPRTLSRSFAKSAATAATSSSRSASSSSTPAAGPRSEVRLNSMFLSKPCSLALPPDSPLRAEDPHYEGIKRFLLTLLLFYSKQSKSIRGANVVYDRITSQVDSPAIYDGFTSDNNFNYSWHHKLGSTVGAVLIGQAAFFIGLSGGTALAQEDSINLAAAASEQTEGNAAGLQRIEDGSVISNEHTVKWRIFTDNARDYFQKRQLDEAEKLFQAALHEAKEGFGLRDPHVASALNNLAEFYRLRKEYEKAELLYLEAIEILEESFGSDDIRVGTALHSLGICYHLQHKFSQAQACYEHALKIEGRVMGLGHPEYASTMYLLAKVLSLQGKRKDAESLIEESIRILEEAGLGESPTCIQRMRYLSTELLKSYRFPEAENWQRKILHALELSKGWDSLDTANAAGLLSLTLQSMGKFKESEELLERCLIVRRRILSEVHFMVAGTLVQLARLTLHKFAMDFKNISNDVATSYLHRTKQLTDESIRITDGILKSSSTSTTDMNKIAATLVLLQSLDVVGLLEVGVKQMLAPGLVLLLRLPLERMKHGSFKIDAVSISDTCRLFIWPDINLIDEQDHKPIEEALNKCISLYKEPNTRSLVSKTLKQDYITCLRRLTVIVETNHVISQTIKLQELLGEAQQIMEELGEASNRKK